MIKSSEINTKEEWDKWVATAKAWQPDFVPEDPGTFQFLIVSIAMTDANSKKTVVYKIFYAIGLKLIANRLNK